MSKAFRTYPSITALALSLLLPACGGMTEEQAGETAQVETAGSELTLTICGCSCRAKKKIKRNMYDLAMVDVYGLAEAVYLRAASNVGGTPTKSVFRWYYTVYWQMLIEQNKLSYFPYDLYEWIPFSSVMPQTGPVWECKRKYYYYNFGSVSYWVDLFKSEWQGLIDGDVFQTQIWTDYVNELYDRVYSNLHPYCYGSPPFITCEQPVHFALPCYPTSSGCMTCVGLWSYGCSW